MAITNNILGKLAHFMVIIYLVQFVWTIMYLSKRLQMERYRGTDHLRYYSYTYKQIFWFYYINKKQNLFQRHAF